MPKYLVFYLLYSFCNLVIKAVYRFHVYYHVRQVLKRLQAPLPLETGFNAADNPYMSSEFLEVCEDYGVPNDPMRYRDEKFYWTFSTVLVGLMITLAQTQ